MTDYFGITRSLRLDGMGYAGTSQLRPVTGRVPLRSLLPFMSLIARRTSAFLHLCRSKMRLPLRDVLLYGYSTPSSIARPALGISLLDNRYSAHLPHGGVAHPVMLTWASPR